MMARHWLAKKPTMNVVTAFSDTGAMRDGHLFWQTLPRGS